ncbi:MAG: 50S ribosomal protein L32 [Alphaproteobacteria bacterium]|jgi:large subunit ribosomal protein L32
MAVPKKKKSKSCRNMRRSHDALKAVNLVENATSGELSRPHQISPDGYYNGRKIFEEPAAFIVE